MPTPKAGKGYRSPVDLGLPQMPQNQDPELFTEFLQLYNACHLLNSYLDQIRLILEGGKPTDTPAESLRFTRSFWMPAGTTIEEGMVISINGGKVWPGADRRNGINKFTGLALSGGPTDDMIRFGVGPGVIEIPGFKADQNVWATLRGEVSAGQLFNEKPEVEDGDDPESVIIGFCIKDNFVLIIPNYA